MMAPLFSTKVEGHHFLTVTSSSSPQTSLYVGSTSKAGNAKGKDAAPKPWANEPWPLIEPPSRTQHITHPALHIANEIALIHNAMLRGLNAIYLQAPHVRQVQDVADLLFLVECWSAWLLDHHDLKENVMLPGFEKALSVQPGTLTLARNPSREVSSSGSSSTDGEEEEELSFLLHRVYAYASATHKDPQSYDWRILEALLASLADVLVPHLTTQVGLLAHMAEMCSTSAAQAGIDVNTAGPLPMPMVRITRTPANTLPSPATATSSSSSSSSPSSSKPSSPGSPPLSLFPAVSQPQLRTANGKSRSLANISEVLNTDTDVNEHRARARALLEADERANRLMPVYLAADAQASATMDRFVVPPMIVRLRDITFSPSLSSSSSSSSLSQYSPGGGAVRGTGSMNGMGVGIGGGSSSDWPRLSVLAIHAIADKLSPRHAGAWRFLPCDVWGRPKELAFLG
ncbi:hypothetical protein F5Y19DRAFT_316753 [Xylariaceae sp. FL1651]|nr:hypothetical protein F5Y19DRAFT_316753 [Xylariaceae sp. FL1651]